MWMGGNVPLGYDPHGRTLVVNEAEAEQVRQIFQRYLELGSVHILLRRTGAQQDIARSGAPRLTGSEIGGAALGRGALFHLLPNRLYLGEIVHKETAHPGLHPPILDVELFQRRPAQAGCRTAAPSGGKAGLDTAPPAGAACAARVRRPPTTP